MNRHQRRKQERKQKKDMGRMPEVLLSDNIFLKGTKFRQKKIVFLFRSGGLGDYINFMPTMLYIAKEHPQVFGLLYVSDPFYDVAKYIMKDFKNFRVRKRETLKDLKETAFINDIDPWALPINATGAHLMDLGSIYYAGLTYLPKEHRLLPQIKYRSGKDWGLPKKYCVFTPGYTAKTRRIKPKYYNELLKYCESIGVTPVHLGKANFSHTEASKTQGYSATIQEEYNLDIGINLTEKTTILEAIEIMEHAQFVIGLDNGLLHFAGCTEVPIIFGHTITTVDHRNIRRKEGMTINIEVSPNSLSCIGCQSKMRYVGGHRHSSCFYDHYACLDLLFDKDCDTWKKAIDHVLNSTKNHNHIIS